MEQVVRYSDAGASVVADKRHFPILIVAWKNAATSKLVDEYYKLRWECDERARRENTKVIIISDLSKFKPPPATIRKELAEKAKDTDASEYFHYYVTVVPNALLRGVVTALQWVGGEQVKGNTNVSDLAAAIDRSKIELQKAGVEPPDVDSATYELPPFE